MHARYGRRDAHRYKFSNRPSANTLALVVAKSNIRRQPE